MSLALMRYTDGMGKSTVSSSLLARACSGAAREGSRGGSFLVYMLPTKLGFNKTLGAFIALLGLFSLAGCLEAISAFGTGALVTAEYVFTGQEPRTLSHAFNQTKRAVLIALCRMNIPVDNTLEIEDGEEIVGRAGKLEIRVELKSITPTVTRIAVKAEENLLNRDKATAREIIRQTVEIADALESDARGRKNARL
jgi:hypothetical protein